MASKLHNMLLPPLLLYTWAGGMEGEGLLPQARQAHRLCYTE